MLRFVAYEQYRKSQRNNDYDSDQRCVLVVAVTSMYLTFALLLTQKTNCVMVFKYPLLLHKRLKWTFKTELKATQILWTGIRYSYDSIKNALVQLFCFYLLAFDFSKLLMLHAIIKIILKLLTLISNRVFSIGINEEKWPSVFRVTCAEQ